MMRTNQSSSVMPESPSSILGAGSFNQWYPGQYDLFRRLLDWYYQSPAQYLGLSVPTGSGKSLDAILLSKVTNARTVILTSTKGLTRQYLRDIRHLGGVEAKGQNNFRCLLYPDVSVEDAPCHIGLYCREREDICQYYLQLREARESQLVVTNYAYWLAQGNYSTGLGPVDLLVCDEAHLAFNTLESFLAVYLRRDRLAPLGLKQFPSIRTDDPEAMWREWRIWSKHALEIAKEEADNYRSYLRESYPSGGYIPPAKVQLARDRDTLVVRLARLSKGDAQWVVEQLPHGFRFVPKWVAGHSRHLFQPVALADEPIPKILLMSAVLLPRTADYLGIPQGEERDWVDAASYFPPENTPIYHIPTARINHRTGENELRLWVSRIDQIIQRRLDRKGLIFTVSYDRANLLVANSRFKDIMITHRTADVVQAVAKFKESNPPVVLVSPSVGTGYDFPMQDGIPQYIILGKIPYGDTSDPVTKARQQDDKDWSSYVAMENLVQSAGRATRSSTDKSEVLCVDDNWLWFWGRYKDFAPRWFRDRVRGSLSTVPGPLV